MFRRVVLLISATAGALTLLAGSAAAGTGPVVYSPAEAGYTATGSHFTTLEVYVKLPDAAKFAGQVGRLRLSLQLWTAASVLDLGLSACTDSSCSPGGTPVTSKYQPTLSVFSRSTGALVCSTANSTCPGVPSSWKNARFSPGTTADMSLFYDPGNGFTDAQVNNAEYLNYSPGPGTVFSQARIAAEFGPTPWSTAAFRAPAAEKLLATFGVPPGPPYLAELVSASGHASCFTASWWTAHQAKMTATGTSASRVEARPHGLSNLGCDFSVYLEP